MAKRHKVICPYCGKWATCQDSSVVYGRSYGWIWICFCVPGRAYVGCHSGTKAPLGTLADMETRKFRKRAHAAFDPIWRGGVITRREAYVWLASVIDVSPEQAHIARSDAEQCRQIIQACAGRVAK